MIFDIGRICVKIAGRDANKRCVIIDVLDNNFVMIDGETRRRRCNVNHIEPLKDKVSIKKNASTKDVITAFKKFGIEISETKAKTKKSEKPTKIRKTTEKKETKKVTKKPATKKAEEKPKAETEKVTEKKTVAKPKTATKAEKTE
jgi:large subunit ribosomal protein L14e